MIAKALLATLALLLATAAPASAAIVINEVESDGAVDFVELFNNGPATVNIGGWHISDSNNNNDHFIPVGTMLAGGQYLVVEPDGPGGFGLGRSDQARLFDGATLVDSLTWTEHALTTFGRCPDGTGPLNTNAITAKPSKGTANTCPGPITGATWPGGTSITVGDAPAQFGDNMSGLAYQPSGTAERGVLWAVRNDPGTLYRLTANGTTWGHSAGWAPDGKPLRYTDGAGNPDAEGVTLAGDPNAVYVATERNGDDSTVSFPLVLRYDVSGAGSPLTATDQWNLTKELPLMGANLGLEAIAWMPDDVLVAKGLVDASTGAKYDPARYAGHGTGLFFVGVEEGGTIYAFALSPGSASKIATIESGFVNVQDLEYEPESKLLWAACDDNCLGRTSTLDISPATGRFAVTGYYERPAGMANLNNEGFAIAPQAECVNQFKPAFWLDDTNALGNAIRVGSIRCTVPTVDPGPPPTPVATVAPTPVPTTSAPDRTAPKVRVSLTKPAKKGTYAVRKTGKLKLTITLDERSDLTIKVSARKTKKAKLRTLTTTTRKGVAAGKPSYTLTLSSKVRKALKAGEKLTIAVQARDTAGNVGTGSASGTVR